ncbi:MAG: cytochrome c3 family protein [Desulfuromusa sp.]|nr:cytochrome c3 family protein [Desulfuromusa sp.]
MNLIWILFFVLQVLFLLPSYAVALHGCLGCHETTVADGDARIYLHSPFAQRQCDTCHAAEVSSSGADNKQAKQKSTKARRKKITWLGDSVAEGSRHGFVLPGNKLGEVLVVEKKGSGSVISREEIAVPLLDNLEEVADSGKPPIISDVRVLKVQRGVFLSVTIGWKTDSLTKPLVSYGEKDLSQKSEASKRYSREHRVTVYSLKPDKKYKFTVIAKDLFGRSQVSEVLTFSTEKPLSNLSRSIVADEQGQSSEAVLDVKFKRLGSNYLVELMAANPFLAFVGSFGEVRKQQKVEKENGDSTESIEQHKNLSSKSFNSIQACQKCHLSQKVVTHPINVFPKPGMTIPPEYPTLPDGRITCATCHSTHGSDYEYLAIKPGRRELCVGCHKDML